MVTFLVVDDVPLDRLLAGALLLEHPGWTVNYAEDGQEALVLIQESLPDVVLTDIQMPLLDGLQLVEAMHRDYPQIPVVLMTAHGSEESAVAALKAGAASYVPKRDLFRDLISTCEKVLDLARVKRSQKQALECLAETELRFILSNEPIQVPALIHHLQTQLVAMGLVDQSSVIRVGTALQEGIINAMEHGNLEVSSELREGEDFEAYRRVIDERRELPPYRDRRVEVIARISREEARFTIRDQGPGFDTTKLPDPRDPMNLQKCSGRGLFLIRTFMDDVSFGKNGTEIVMTKHK